VDGSKCSHSGANKVRAAMRIGVQALALALALSKFVPESAVKSFALETVGSEGAEVKGRWSPPRWWSCRCWLT
jgi:hypothetical protein